jgi:hypothetical protein
LQIGNVAKGIGLSVDAIRFHERNALLPLAPGTNGGFRRYGNSDVETFLFFRCVQVLGFTRFANSWECGQANGGRAGVFGAGLSRNLSA